jgi:hypothetical protein
MLIQAARFSGKNKINALGESKGTLECRRVDFALEDKKKYHEMTQR